MHPQGAAWFEQHLAAWEACHAATLPPPLRQLLLDEGAAVSSKLVAWLLWAMAHVGAYRRYRQQALDPSQRLSMVRGGADELSALHDAELRDGIVRLQQRVQQECSLLEARCGQLLGSRQELVWGFDLVKSRTFSAPAPCAGSSWAGVKSSSISIYMPFADLANHSPWPSCEFVVVDGSPQHPQNEQQQLPASCPSSTSRAWRFVLQPRATCRGIGPQQEISISYGDGLSNAQLLASYGFCLPGNPHDRLPAAWLSQQPAAAIKTQLLAR